MDGQDESPVKHHKAQQQGCERTSASGLATAGQSVRIAETLLAGSVGHDKGGESKIATNIADRQEFIFKKYEKT